MPYPSDESKMDTEGENETNHDDLVTLTVAELRSLAAGRGVSLSGMRRKAEIVDAIQSALSSESEAVSENTEVDE